MHKTVLFALALAASAGAPIQLLSHAQAQAALPAQREKPFSTAEGRAAVLNAVSLKMEQGYVFPKVAGEVSRRLLQERRALLAIADPAAFAKAVQKVLSDVAKDGHLSISHDPAMYERLVAPAPAAPAPAPAPKAEPEASFVSSTDGFRKVELLDGNIGYIDIEMMANVTERSGARAAAAMAFIGEAGAIIIDLRRNPGGSGRMNQLLSTYFFADGGDTLLIRNENRSAGKNVQEWTLPFVPGRRRPDVPLFFLVDSGTGSAAEGFAYNLQARGRAKVVGEPTAGAAHSGSYVPLASGFVMFLPTGLTINPVTNGNWERTGVIPDIKVSSDLALEKALEQIWVERKSRAVEGSADAARASWHLAYHQARLQPPGLPANASDYVGSYADGRSIALRDGALHFHREGAPPIRLAPLTDGSFVMEGRDYNGAGNVRVRFVRGATGTVERIQVQALHPVFNLRTSDHLRTGA